MSEQETLFSVPGGPPRIIRRGANSDPEYMRVWRAKNPERVQSYKEQGKPLRRRRDNNRYATDEKFRAEKRQLSSWNHHRAWWPGDKESFFAYRANLYAQQGGRCAGCGRLESELPCALHLDHDHTRSKPRALLCGDCNLAIGKLNDDPGTLRRLADILEKTFAEPINEA